METSQTISIIELQPIDLLEKRMERIVQLVNVGEDMGFPLDGFYDENDLLRKVSEIEIALLSDLIYSKDKQLPSEQVFRAELKLEKFNALACRIIDAIRW